MPGPLRSRTEVASTKTHPDNEVTERARSATECAFDDLDSVLTETVAAFERLSQKLHPVMSPVCEGSTEDCSKELSRGSSPLVHQIQNIRSSIASLQYSINQVTNALEV